MIAHSYLKGTIQAILLNADKLEWTIQGFGMLRMHFSDRFRLNIWDSRYRVLNVSMIHTHPWNFESLVVVGEVQNIRYDVDTIPTNGTKPYYRALIKPGVTFDGSMDDTKIVHLEHYDLQERITEGCVYRQEAHETHMSLPVDGTITLNDRTRVGEDVAYVYWPLGEEWVSAKPRIATQEEVRDITRYSLETYFNGLL
jgi:hypothetical protein